MAGLSFQRPLAGNVTAGVTNAQKADVVPMAPRSDTRRGARMDANGVELPKAQFWVNIGYVAELPMDDGTVEQMFVGLPYGVPLDTMNDAEVRGNSAEAMMLAQAKNGLKAKLIEIASQLAPGEEYLVHPDENSAVPLVMQIRRVGQPTAVAPGENPLLAALASRFGKLA